MITIEVKVKMNMQTGACEVTGPLEQKPLCVKALAAAINAVVDFVPQAKPEPKILVPPPPNFRNGNGGKPH